MLRTIIHTALRAPPPSHPIFTCTARFASQKMPPVWQFRESEDAEWEKFDALHTKALERASKSKAKDPPEVSLKQGSGKKQKQLVVSLPLMSMRVVEDDTLSYIVRRTTDQELGREAKRKREEEEEEDSSDDSDAADGSTASESSDAPQQPPQKKAKMSPKKPSSEAVWTKVDSVLVYTTGPSDPPTERIASFDMDDTVVMPKSGAVFPKNKDDWMFLCSEVPKKLAKLHSEGVRIMFFSNQAGIGKKGHWDASKATEIKTKITNISKKLGFPIDAFLATGSDAYRKPGVDMWELMVKTIDFKGNKSDCIYVGDAAGRTILTLANRKKDFSCSDRKFAHNVGIAFQTPEQYFKHMKTAPFSWGSFNPEAEAKTLANMTATDDGRETFHKDTQEVVLFVGPPASGKSTFALKHFVANGYVHVNRDTLKTPAKCLRVMREALAAGKSVVVDNTNPKEETREDYITAAENVDVPVRCFYFTTSMELAKHLNQYREVITKGERPHVPGIAYNMYKSGFSEPEESEGFTEIVKIRFVPHFANSAEKALFNCFLT